MGLKDFFLGSDEWKTPPMVQGLYDKYLGMLDEPMGGFQGLTSGERELKRRELERTLRKSQKAKMSSATASLGRRGIKSPGILKNLMAETGGQYTEAYGAGLENIQSEDFATRRLNKRLAEQKKGQLRQLLAMLSGQQQYTEKPGFLQGLLDVGGTAAGTYLGRKL